MSDSIRAVPESMTRDNNGNPQYEYTLADRITPAELRALENAARILAQHTDGR